MLHRFVIERDIPGAGAMDGEQLVQTVTKSNGVLQDLGPGIQWDHSYVANDKIYCVYVAKDEDIVREHAKLSGFPADRISEIRRVIDPTYTA
jgi:hypothetical protein